MMESFLAFLAVAVVVIVTPGLDTAITIRNTLLGGRTGGIMTALGIALGQTIWAVATSCGIVALLVASGPLFLALKYAGAAYLIYLGAMALREALLPPAGRAQAHVIDRPGSPLKPIAGFRQGLISDLGNPKMAVFFASLLPQFVPAGEASFQAFLLLGVFFAAMTFAWLLLYAVFIAKLGAVLRRPSIHRTIEAVTGTVLVGLGIRVAAEQQ